MLNMILADDEPIITRGIRKLVDWEKLGIFIEGEYRDGHSAMEAILSGQPDLALLDISMPGMNGIDILKSIREMELKTKVVFISGFQESEYASRALKYGAVDYLLKPVIREQLLTAVEKAVEMIYGNNRNLENKFADSSKENKERIAEIELETTTYLPILISPLFDGIEGEQEKKLIRFSLISFLEEYLAECKKGILFSKQDNIVIILKAMSLDTAKEVVMQLWKQAQTVTGKKIGFVMGNVVDSMGEIPREYQKCVEMSRYFFFANQIQVPVLAVGNDVFFRKSTPGELSEMQEKLMKSMLIREGTAFDSAYKMFCRTLCLVADGRKEDACYYFCSMVRWVEEQIKALGVEARELELGKLLEKTRQCVSFAEMESLFEKILRKFEDIVSQSMENCEKKEILLAKQYIDEHYQENLTLEVLAKQLHMNPYYFSSFFKNQAGENFKDYVNKVRLRHAVSMLLTTDLKTYEIAERAGFRDVRYFTKVFSHAYKETPSAYRKRTNESLPK